MSSGPSKAYPIEESAYKEDIYRLLFVVYFITEQRYNLNIIHDSQEGINPSYHP